MSHADSHLFFMLFVLQKKNIVPTVSSAVRRTTRRKMSRRRKPAPSYLPLNKVNGKVKKIPVASAPRQTVKDSQKDSQKDSIVNLIKNLRSLQQRARPGWTGVLSYDDLRLLERVHYKVFSWEKDNNSRLFFLECDGLRLIREMCDNEHFPEVVRGHLIGSLWNYAKDREDSLAIVRAGLLPVLRQALTNASTSNEPSLDTAFSAAGTLGFTMPGMSMCADELACIPLMTRLVETVGLCQWDPTSGRYVKRQHGGADYVDPAPFSMLLKIVSFSGAFFSAVSQLPDEETQQARAKKQVAALEALEAARYMEMLVFMYHVASSLPVVLS